MTTLRAAFRLVAFITALVVLATVLKIRVAARPSDARPRARAMLQHRACRILLRILGGRIQVVGTLPADRRCLIVSNHLGVLDAWALAAAMHTSFVVKVEMASWPVIGWILRAVGVLFVDRDRRMETRRFATEVQHRMRAGVAVTVFPEGTVGGGRRLLRFRTGAFEAVAGSAEYSVVPVFMHAVALDGVETSPDTRARVSWQRGESMLAHTMRVLGHRRVDLEIRIGVPIAAENRNRKDLASLSQTAVETLGADLLDDSIGNGGDPVR